MHYKGHPDYVDPRDCEIYVVRNRINGHEYVGSTVVGREKRYKQHVKALNENKHSSRALGRAWKKYGAENFESILVENCGPQSQRDRKLIELRWVALRGYYNAMKSDDGRVSFVPSEEVRKVQSESMKAGPAKASWEDPDKYKRHIEGFRTPEARTNRKSSAKTGWEKRRLDPKKVHILRSDEHKEKQSKIITEHYADPAKKASILEKRELTHRANPDIRLKQMPAAVAKFYEDHPEKKDEFKQTMREARAKFFEKHPQECDNISKRVEQWHKDNPEKVRASQEKSRASNLAIFADPVKKAARLKKWRDTKLRNKNLNSLARSRAIVDACIKTIETSGTL